MTLTPIEQITINNIAAGHLPARNKTGQWIIWTKPRSYYRVVYQRTLDALSRKGLIYLVDTLSGKTYYITTRGKDRAKNLTTLSTW